MSDPKPHGAETFARLCVDRLELGARHRFVGFVREADDRATVATRRARCLRTSPAHPRRPGDVCRACAGRSAPRTMLNRWLSTAHRWKESDLVAVAQRAVGIDEPSVAGDSHRRAMRRQRRELLFQRAFARIADSGALGRLRLRSTCRGSRAGLRRQASEFCIEPSFDGMRSTLPEL